MVYLSKVLVVLTTSKFAVISDWKVEIWIFVKGLEKTTKWLSKYRRCTDQESI